MNAYATIEFLSNTVNQNGYTVGRAVVEINSQDGTWLGSFTAFGNTEQEIKDRAYMEADLKCKHKGYTLQSLREI